METSSSPVLLGETGDDRTVDPASTGAVPDADATGGDHHGLARGVEVGLEPFRLIGFSWSGSIEARVRTHHLDGSWSGWSPIHDDSEHGLTHGDSEHGHDDGAGTRTVSEPIWVGDADGYEVIVESGGAELTVHQVRSGTGRVAIGVGTPAAGAHPSAPSISARGSWGAREPAASPVIADELRFVVVHHTGVLAHNRYGRDEVPDLIRSVQAFHMDVRGWSDIGYNFLIDRFGRVWEGRAGGADRPVVGAHAMGFNTASAGVALIGELNRAQPSGAALDSLAALAGWKLFLHGIDPLSEVVVTSSGSPGVPRGQQVRLSRIVGHRDIGSTTCPGDHAHDDLASVRAAAAAGAGGQADGLGFRRSVIDAPTSEVAIPGDFDGDGRGDVFWYSPGAAADRVWYGGADGSVTASAANVRGRYEPVVGDFDGDGRSDILWHAPGSGQASLSYGLAGRSPKFSTVDLQVPTSETPLVGDFDGDGHDDVMWYRPGSAVDSLWWGRSRGRFDPVDRQVWGSYQPIVGDFDGNGASDIWWYAPGPALDTIWYGSSSGTFADRAQKIDGTYGAAVGDLDGDGTDDVVLHADGSRRTSVFMGSSDRRLRLDALATEPDARPLFGDFTAGGADELLFVDPEPGGSRRAWVWRRGADGRFAVSADGAPSGTPLVTDLNGDGVDDVLWVVAGRAETHLWLAG